MKNLLIGMGLCMAVSYVSAAELVNMPKLLAQGESYNEKTVHLSAYVCSNPDSEAGLFLTPDDCAVANYDHAIELDRKPDTACEGLVAVSGKFFFIEGGVRLDSPYQWGRLLLDRYRCVDRS